MVYFHLEKFFKRFPLWVAAAIGGFCTGIIGLLVPSVIGTGYGWAQFAISQDVQLLPPLMLLLAAVAEIVGASLTLGSGNSGGIFGPCVVTGGMFGGASVMGLHSLSFRDAASRHLCDRRHDCLLCRRR